ncbi:hypothetical protein BASA84_001448 [Batrachochytrium salamandrivorans]|nr:hypothetical protein BASA84_001448 [Batrachochytrium salamandrivorans]
MLLLCPSLGLVLLSRHLWLNVYKRAVASLNPSSTEFPFYFPESVYESIPHSGAPPSPSSETDDAKIATDFISKRLNLGADDFKVSTPTLILLVSPMYGAHMANGARIANHQAAAHVNNGEVFSFSSSFNTDQHLTKRDITVSAPEATVDFAKASATASAQLGIPVDSEFEHVLEYVAQPGGKIVYAYRLQLRDNPMTKWVEVWCDATTGMVIQVIDFAKKASYRSSHFLVVMPLKDFMAGNFQKSNFGKGGREGVMFSIAPLKPPNRSDSLDNGIIVHEYTHGISDRLTGGPLVDAFGQPRQEAWVECAPVMRPYLLECRNAILDADASHYKGAHSDTIYKGFAKRGLGFGATNSYINDFSVPPECR